MKVAVTTDENKQVFQHFGHCKLFTLAEVAEGAVQQMQMLDASGSGHEALAELLKANGVQTLICGGIGAGAKNALEAAQIEIFAGVQGGVEQALEQYAKGTLEKRPIVLCNHHGHGHAHGQEEGHACHCGNH